MNLFRSSRVCQSQTLHMSPESAAHTMTLVGKAG